MSPNFWYGNAVIWGVACVYWLPLGIFWDLEDAVIIGLGSGAVSAYSWLRANSIF